MYLPLRLGRLAVPFGKVPQQVGQHKWRWVRRPARCTETKRVFFDLKSLLDDSMSANPRGLCIFASGELPKHDLKHFFAVPK